MPYKNKIDAATNKSAKALAERVRRRNLAVAQGITLTQWMRENLSEYYILNRLIAYCSRRAKLSGLSRTVKAAHLRQLLIEQKGLCPLTGVILRFGAGMAFDNVSLDRIDPKLGYDPGNVRLVCWWANAARSTLPDCEFITWCSRVVANSLGVTDGN